MNSYTVSRLVLIYLVLALITLFIWNKRDLYPITGDEPHYLVMTQGFIRDKTFEQMQPYKIEFQTRKIFKEGLAAYDAVPSPANTHTVWGPHGLFNVHNIGLPLLLAIPFYLGGALGTKVFLILCSSFILITTWQVSVRFNTNLFQRWLAVFATCIALPFIPGANQIYPDLLAGWIALSGLYWFFTLQKKRPRPVELAWITLLVFLPWLQIKFIAPCLLLIVGLSVKRFWLTRHSQDILPFLLITFLSCAGLMSYNNYAFGSIFGPYQANALELSKTSLMVVLGLFLDQNHGFLWQNPIHFIGLFAIGCLFYYDKFFTWLWLLVFLSLLIPNGLHTNWYGGYSFSGRFAWSATVVFIIPSLYGLLLLGQINPRLFKSIISFGIFWQAGLFYRYALCHPYLYNKSSLPSFGHYSTYYGLFSHKLPMWYDVSWAYHYTPNFVWLALAVFLLIAGAIPHSFFERSLSLFKLPQRS